MQSSSALDLLPIDPALKLLYCSITFKSVLFLGTVYLSYSPLNPIITNLIDSSVVFFIIRITSVTSSERLLTPIFSITSISSSRSFFTSLLHVKTIIYLSLLLLYSTSLCISLFILIINKPTTLLKFLIVLPSVILIGNLLVLLRFTFFFSYTLLWTPIHFILTCQHNILNLCQLISPPEPFGT